jgi:hypothetical protein
MNLKTAMKRAAQLARRRREMQKYYEDRAAQYTDRTQSGLRAEAKREAKHHRTAAEAIETVLAEIVITYPRHP